MSEPVLKSIIQLLAISAITDGNLSISEVSLIDDFIADQVSEESTPKYLSLFQEYAEIALTTKIEPKNIFKRINGELNQKQKVIVLSHLLEVAAVECDDKSLVFVDNAAASFNVDELEYGLLKKFILPSAHFSGDSQYILIMSSRRYTPPVKYIHREGLESMISVLRLPNTELYFARLLQQGNTNVFLNNVVLRPRHLYAVPTGAVFRCETSNPIYFSDIVGRFRREYVETPILLEAKHVYYTFQSGKLGLRDLNISEEGGRLVGIMGGSGSGKSTTINVLNGQAIPIGGQVILNGIDIYNEAENHKIKGLIGYVPQDDLLIEELTVFQNLYYASKLCYGHFSEHAIKHLVEKTLINLGLFEIAHLKVGNPLQKTISGGQRKRLNIALELIREPAVMFLDEPTSGLSSRDSENIMDLLKELTSKGKLIFVVIHQPSSDIFKMFDRLLILDVGGYPIYYGNPLACVNYFRKQADLLYRSGSVCGNCGHIEVEQIFEIIETKIVDEYGHYTPARKVSPAQWHKNFLDYKENQKKNSAAPTQIPAVPPLSLHIPNKLKQLLIFIKRDVLAKLSNTQYMFIALLEAPFLAFVLASIVKFSTSQSNKTYFFSENVNLPAYIFMSIIVCLFIGLTVSAEEIIKDAKIRKRETFLHLSRGSYLMSKVIILFSFSFVQTLSFVLIGNWILEIDGKLWNYWFVLFTVSCTANILGLNISSAFSSVVAVYILIPILIIPQLILGGIVIKFDEMNPHIAGNNRVPWVSEFMFSRWAFEALIVSEFKDNAFEKNFYQYDKEMAKAEYKSIYYIPKLESMLEDAIILQKDSIPENRNNNTIKIDEICKTLRLEIWRESKLHAKANFPTLKIIYPAVLNEKNIKKIRTYLTLWKEAYIKIYNANNKIKDKIIGNITKTREGRGKFIDAKHIHHNETIENLVKNTDETHRVVLEKTGVLRQKIYPIFLDAPQNPLKGRPHFYAPVKWWGIDTYWFNVMVLWFFTLILYVSLYFNVIHESLKVVITVFGRKKSFIR
ncbi:MAG: ATP-binding cassette domain-containing protein [Cytophagia bacterium]|nr:MAG: ATP-binding cassette domain-containing protein [Cytophagia bacterium]